MIQNICLDFKISLIKTTTIIINSFSKTLFTIYLYVIKIMNDFSLLFDATPIPFKRVGCKT